MCILRAAMEAIDYRLAEHGERVAYILYKMLRFSNRYRENDNKIFATLAILHDLGAFKTEQIETLLRFETTEVFSHSVYGYLYLRYLSPFEKYADVVLYHHLPYQSVNALDTDYKDVINCLVVADRVELLMRNGHLGSEYTDGFRDGTLSPEALELFLRANKYYRITDAIKKDNYKNELDGLLQSVAWDQQVTDRLLKLLVFILDFRHEETVLRTIRAVGISDYLAAAMQMPAKERESLHYAALTYDLGMLSVPDRVIYHRDKLSVLQREMMKKHVRVLNKLLQSYVAPDIYTIAQAHHERLDGSGYLAGNGQDGFSAAQRILMVSDTVAAMNTTRPDRPALARAEVLNSLDLEVTQGRLCTDAVHCTLRNYDDMMEKVNGEGRAFSKDYFEIKQQFGVVMQKLLHPAASVLASD